MGLNHVMHTHTPPARASHTARMVSEHALTNMAVPSTIVLITWLRGARPYDLLLPLRGYCIAIASAQTHTDCVFLRGLARLLRL